ncbi:MAG TPA: ABC transporter ATP-binding protein [Gaiellaceae bacterium]|jgi:ABC-2 type transport system ATP-binding protein|nr:ABC transporter ATP-binding protein [Gaiellaceae bacterium]
MTTHVHELKARQGSPAVETDSLSKRFDGRLAVDDVDLQVPRGVAFGYLGPNGAGKTTLIRMLLGLTSATTGSMRLLGLPVPARRTQALARVGAIVEDPRFHGHLTGRENLAVVAAARAGEAWRRIDDSLERVGLTARADERVKTYSLGMRQRLGIARCLLADPELLILDEPMNGLDPAGIQEFRGFVRSFVDEGRTIVLSSHLLDEVEKTCDAIAIVDRGRIVAQGSLAELRRDGDPTVLIETSDAEAAAALLEAHPAVRSVAANGATLRLTLADVNAVADLNRRLVEAGHDVLRLEPARASLEDRFLKITTRLENAA